MDQNCRLPSLGSLSAGYCNSEDKDAIGTLSGPSAGYSAVRARSRTVSYPAQPGPHGDMNRYAYRVSGRRVGA